MATKRHSVEIVINAIDKAQATLGKVTGFLGGLGKAAGVMALGAVAGIGAVGAALGKLAMDAVPVQAVSQTFDALTASIGETSDAMLADLRAATNSMVNDADLMQSANKLVSMGLATSSEEASKLSGMAARLGMAMGGSATESMENFALTLANQSIPRLDSFGISGAAVSKRIEELMASTKGMTRESAFMTAVMEQGEVALNRLGDAGKTGAAVSLAQLKATMDNLKTAAGTALLPALQAIITPLAEMATKYAPQVGAAFDTVGKAIETVVNLVGAGIAPLNALKYTLLGMAPESARGQIQAIFDVLDRIGAVVTGTVIPAVQAAATWLGTNLPVAAQAASTFWTGTLQPALAAVGAYIQGTVVPAIGSLVTWLQTNLPLAVQTLVTFWTGTLQPALAAAAPVVAQIAQAFADVGTNIATYVAPMLPGIATSFGSLKEPLLSVWGALQQLWTAIQPVIALIGGALVVAFGVAVGAVQGVAQGLTALVQTAANVLAGIALFVTGVVQMITGLFNTVIGLITGNNEMIAAGVQQLADGAQATIQGFWDALVALMLGASNAIIATLGGLVQGAATFLAQLPGIAGTELGNTLAKIGEFAGAMVQAGSDLIAGVATGITNGGAAVWAALSGVVDAAIAAIKSKLGISSPSRLFADEIGGPMMAGVSVGARSEARDMQATFGDLLQGLAGGGMTPAFAPAGAGGRGPVSVYVTLNATVASGQDVNDLAWRVSEVIAQRLKALS